jgi:hypothetical protein
MTLDESKGSYGDVQKNVQKNRIIKIYIFQFHKPSAGVFDSSS